MTVALHFSGCRVRIVTLCPASEARAARTWVEFPPPTMTTFNLVDVDMLMECSTQVCFFFNLLLCGRRHRVQIAAIDDYDCGTAVRLIFNLATRRKIFSGFLEHWNLMSNCTFGGISFIFFLLNGVESPHSILFYPVHRRYSVLSCAYSSDDVRKM